MIILVDPQYNPSGAITSSTELGPGITMAKFLGGRGSRTQLEKLYNDSFTGRADRAQIARNLVLHAQAMTAVISNAEFAQHRLIVSEGIYEPNPKFTVVEQPAGGKEQAKKLAESVPGGSYGKGSDGYVARIPQYIGERAGGVNKKKRVGQAVVYQLIDRNGKTDPAKTFDLAVFWKDYIDYDKLTLDYDTYDPDGSLTCQIVLETPSVPESYEIDGFAYDLQTDYNSSMQAKNELLEILPEEA